MPDTTTAESLVLNVLSEVLAEPVADIRAQPVLAAHEWDSVRMLEVLAQLEARLGSTLDLRSYQAARTVADLVELAGRASADGRPAR